MTWGIRSFALAAGAAALLSAQAAYAAPTPAQSSGVSPLVSLSVLGTSQSRAAVCGGATFGASACGISGSVAASAATSAAASAAATQDNPGNGPNVLVILLALGLAIGGIVAITQGGGSGSGNLNPISPP